jgi:hypothetical protein
MKVDLGLEEMATLQLHHPRPDNPVELSKAFLVGAGGKLGVRVGHRLNPVALPPHDQYQPCQYRIDARHTQQDDGIAGNIQKPAEDLRPVSHEAAPAMNWRQRDHFNAWSAHRQGLFIFYIVHATHDVDLFKDFRIPTAKNRKVIAV